MCNIAGYVGTKTAAPILIDLMRRQEGFNGGYYTGIATVDNGKFYMDKVIGDLDLLLETTEAASHPGTVGVLHSRSKSGGNVEWGHPFIGTGDKLAYIANGAAGVFAESFAQPQAEAYRTLLKNGYRFRSREEGPVGEYPLQADGACVHASDIMCQLITKFVDDGLDTAAAVEKAYCTVASEVVCLVLNADEPDCITWGRINFPLFAGFAPHGIYLASTPQAFPEDSYNVLSMQPMCSGKVYQDRIETRAFGNPPGTIAPATPRVYHDCYEAMCEALSRQELNCEEIDEITPPLFNQATCTPYPAVEYEILYDLQKQGRLEINTYRVDGSAPGLTAPMFKMRLK